MFRAEIQHVHVFFLNSDFSVWSSQFCMHLLCLVQKFNSGQPPPPHTGFHFYSQILVKPLKPSKQKDIPELR